jgi:hypothetical protein
MPSGWEQHPEYGGPEPSGWPLLVIGWIVLALGVYFGLWPILKGMLY